MTRNQWTIVVALAIGVVLEFCLIGILAINRLQGAQQNTAALLAAQGPTTGATGVLTPTATRTPTETPRPTLTPTFVIMGTGLWVLPTSTSISGQSPSKLAGPTRTRVPGPISDALDKTASAKAMRFELEINAQGDFGGIPGMSEGTGSASLFSVSGATNGKDSDLTIKGFLAAFFGGDANKGLEIMTIGDKLYVHGPAPLFGAPEAKWYVGKNDSESGISGMPKTDTVTDSFKGENPDVTKFTKTKTEKFDGQNCDVYTADTAATLELLRSMDTSSLPGQQDLQGLESATTQIWICADGYLHQLKLDMSGHQSGSSEVFGMQVRVHLSDINGKVTLTPPTNAAPLQMPDWFKIETPTPARQSS